MIIVGEANPECFDPVFGAEGTPFSDAYALSWTTFTTVVSIKSSKLGHSKIFL